MMAGSCPIQVVAFDLGGVLIQLSGLDTMVSWTQGRWSVETLWDRWLGSPVVRRFETGQSTAAEFADTLIAEMQLPVGRDEFLRAFESWPARLYDGVRPLLAAVREQFTMVCFSNTNDLHWQRIQGELRLPECFDRCFPSHLTGVMKPDPDAYTYLINALEVEPRQILFVDDNRINVQAAIAAGIQAYQTVGIGQVRDCLTALGIHCPPAATDATKAVNP